jgi:hypothetical protein
MEIDTNELHMFLGELYPHKDGKRYYIQNPDWGYFSKKDGDIICDFLRKNLFDILDKLKEK